MKREVSVFFGGADIRPLSKYKISTTKNCMIYVEKNYTFMGYEIVYFISPLDRTRLIDN